jgi:cyanophycinase
VKVGPCLLCLLPCGACSLLTDESSRFSAETDSMGEDDDDSAPTDDGGIPDEQPPQPAWLTVYTIGNPDNLDVEPLGPGLLLVGADTRIDSAYQWQSGLIAGGDIVVLRPDDLSDSNDFNTYLYEQIGGADSVQTLIVEPGAASSDPWIAWTLAHAEAVLIVAEDPYHVFWKDTLIAAGIMAAWQRNAVIGGVDAGLNSLGEFVYPGYGTLSSQQSLEDPYAPDLALERDYLTLEPLADALIEPRFVVDDRMGRLLAFAARVLQDDWSNKFVGIGIDENAAMVIGPDNLGEVHGDGNVYLFHAKQADAGVCEPGVPLEFGPVTVYTLVAGDRANWPGGETNAAGVPVSATLGVTEPPYPY